MAACLSLCPYPVLPVTFKLLHNLTHNLCTEATGNVNHNTVMWASQASDATSGIAEARNVYVLYYYVDM